MLKKKSILITGTSSGLGKSLAEYFSKNNEVISINKIGSENLNINNLENFNINILEYNKVEDLILKLKSENRIPDIFILNAGINKYDNKENFNYENFKDCFETNFYGSMNFVGVIEKFKISNKKILFMSSTSNIIPNPASYGYYASKLLLKESLKFLNINKKNDYKAIILGPVLTNISRDLEKPKGMGSIIFNFLAVKTQETISPIEKFLISKKKILYFTFRSLVIYILLKYILKLFPFLYKGGRK